MSPRRLVDAAATKVKSRGRLKISGYEDDNRIYECAVAAKAHYIVAENTKHFKGPTSTARLSPRVRLKLLLAEEK